MAKHRKKISGNLSTINMIHQVEVLYCEALELYLKQLKVSNHSSNTITNYKNQLNHFFGWLQEECFNDVEASNINLHQTTFKHATNYLNYLALDKRLKPRTINTHVATLRKFYNFCKKKYTVIHNIFEDIPVIKFQEEEIQIPTKDELNKFLSGCDLTSWIDYRFFHIVQVQYYTGIRLSELVNLKNEDLQGGVIKIRNSKNNTFRQIPINKKLEEILKSWKKEQIPDSEYLFTNENGDKLSERTVSYYYHKMSDFTGINIHSHLLRHMYISNLCKSNVPLSTIQKLTGHKNINTILNVYNHVNIDDLKSASNKLNKF